MTLLWPDIAQASAQNSLRQALYHLHQAVPEVAAGSGGDPVHFIRADRQVTQDNPDAAFELDVVTFERLLKGPHYRSFGADEQGVNGDGVVKSADYKPNRMCGLG